VIKKDLGKSQNLITKDLITKDSIIVSGSANPGFNEQLVSLSQKLCQIPQAAMQVAHFPDGEMRVRLGAKEKIAGKQAIVLQSLGKKPNEYLVEAMLIADALRRAGAAKIVLVAPYLAYSRQNLPEDTGSSLAARLFAYFLHEAGVHELVTMDLHAEHIPSFYDFPVRHLTAKKVLAEAVKKRLKALKCDPKDIVVVGPDLGSAKLVAGYAEEFGSSFALIQKRRLDPKSVETLSIVGEVKGKNVLLADDMCSTGATLLSAARVCQGKGAQRIFAACTHGLLVDDALQKINESPIETLFVSDTVAIDEKAVRGSSSKLCVISVAPVFAAVIAGLP